MQFELSDELVDEILFAMEDQNGEFALDARSGTVLDSTEMDEDAVVYPLPEWGSADGFRLMESFASSLRNPVVRAELSAALDRGRGVFRAFKDTLTEHPEVERLWFAYKERRMRQEIIDWYNALRESWGLERIGEEPEETEDLILEDFRFRPARDGDEGVPDGLGGGPAFVAETARGDFAGSAALSLIGPEARVVALEVKPEYRGLGLGEEMLRRLVAAALDSGASELKLDLPAGAEVFSRVLFREGFGPYETRYRLDLDNLRKERR